MGRVGSRTPVGLFTLNKEEYQGVLVMERGYQGEDLTSTTNFSNVYVSNLYKQGRVNLRVNQDVRVVIAQAMPLGMN